MIFGTQDSFAIEAELIEVFEKWVYGHLQFWISGKQIGDFEDSSDLASSARWGLTFLAASDRRTRADLDASSAEDAFGLLYGRFIKRVHSTEKKAWPGPWDRDPYVLDEVGESSTRDTHAIVVVRRSDGVDRVLVKDFESDRVLEALLEPGACDQVIESYCSWVAKTLTGVLGAP